MTSLQLAKDFDTTLRTLNTLGCLHEDTSGDLFSTLNDEFGLEDNFTWDFVELFKSVPKDNRDEFLDRAGQVLSELLSPSL